MLLRIFLIVSILAGAGIIALTHFQVKPHVESIIDERNKQETRAIKAEGDLKKTRADLASTKADLENTRSKLSETENQLAAANTRIGDLDKNLNAVKDTLAKTKDELTKAKQDLGAWTNLGLTVDQVKGVIDHDKKLQEQIAAQMAEYTILETAYKKVCNLYSNLIGNPDFDVVQPLPTNLKGKVLIVDPKWDFVVLDIGEKQGALPNGVMMISRDAKLVAKVKIVTVQLDRCIANIMPGWKLGDVMEGDIAYSSSLTFTKY